MDEKRGENVRTVASKGPELLGTLRLGVDEMIFSERGRRVEGDQRAALDAVAAGLREVIARPCIRVDVEPFQAADLVPALSVEDGRIRRCIFLDDGELDLGPDADLIVFDRHSG